jgi:hypothetical protein
MRARPPHHYNFKPPPHFLIPQECLRVKVVEIGAAGLPFLLLGIKIKNFLLCRLVMFLSKWNTDITDWADDRCFYCYELAQRRCILSKYSPIKTK